MTNEDFEALEHLGKRAWVVYRDPHVAPYWEALPRPAQERWVEVASELWSDGFDEGLKQGKSVQKYLRE